MAEPGESYTKDLEAYLSNLEKKYTTLGMVAWATYNDNPVLHQQKVVVVRQGDFTNGTLRITTPCKIILAENISFNPNRQFDWMPLAKDFLNPDNEKDLAYKRGFFAAIAIETLNVIIDLNGYTIQQHPEHALMQRFFTVIELGDQPFLPNEGPANFGKQYLATNGIWVKNGKIGLTAHHGIHGNRAKNVYIQNVTFQDYEVAAISLHGTLGLTIKNCKCLKTRRDVPVLGQYSAARFGVLFGQYIANMYGEKSKNLLLAYQILKNAVNNKVFNAVINNGSWNDPEIQIFRNPNGMVDGTAYAVLIYPDGVAVNNHLENFDENNATRYIWIENLEVYDTIGCVVETPALLRRDDRNKIQRGMSGEAFLPFDRCMTSDGTYIGNPVSNFQIVLQNLRSDLMADPKSKATIKGEMFGRLSIDPSLAKDWFLGEEKLVWEPNKNSVRLGDAVFDVCYNGDVMHHVCKGIVPIRIEGADTVMLKNVIVKNTQNHGALGQSNTTYQGRDDGGNKGQGQMRGYTGSLATGVCISASRNITIDNLQIDNVVSYFGCATGFMAINNTTNINYVNPVKIGRMAAGVGMTTPSTAMPNLPQVALPYFFGDSCDKPPEGAFLVKPPAQGPV